MCTKSMVVTCGVVALAWASGAMAILPEDYLAVRRLVRPKGVGTEITVQRPGISNAGGVFAVYGEENHEFGVRWLRNSGYAPDDIGRPPLHIKLQPRWVTSEGFVTGRSSGHLNAKESFAVAIHYDMVNNVFSNVGPEIGPKSRAEGYRGNNLGEVPTDTNGFDTRIAFIDSHEEVRLLGTGRPRAIAINDDHVIVGQNATSAIKWEPTGDRQWGEPVALDKLGPPFAPSTANSISNSDPAYVTGSSASAQDFSQHGVVWNAATGEIVADFGSFAQPISINSAGTIVNGFVGFAEREPMLWSRTGDDWSQWTQLNLNEVLGTVQNGERWSSLTSPIDQHFPGNVNDQGQVVGVGVLADFTTTALFVLDTQPLAPAVLKGDVNNDGIVDFLDITPFINAQSAEGDEDAFLLLTPGGCFLCADIDMDGAIDFLDITPFVNLLDEVAAAVPEPASALALVISLVGGRGRRLRSEQSSVSSYQSSVG